VAVFENRQPVTAAKLVQNCSWFILLLSFILLPELKPISEQKVENLFVAPPYCQTACCRPFLVPGWFHGWLWTVFVCNKNSNALQVNCLDIKDFCRYLASASTTAFNSFVGSHAVVVSASFGRVTKIGSCRTVLSHYAVPSVVCSWQLFRVMCHPKRNKT
jgi:hypothetical protein